MLNNEKILAQYDFSDLEMLESIVNTVLEDFPPDRLSTHLCDFEMLFTVVEQTLSDGSKCITIKITQREI